MISAKVSSGAIWTAGSRGYVQAVNFFTMIVAARFLSPADFGFFALASAVVIGFSQLAEAGWREAVLVRHDDPQRAALITTLAALSGLLLTALCFALVLALRFFEFHARAIDLLSFLAPTILVTTLCSVPTALLIQQGRLREMGIVQCVSESIGLLTAIAAFRAGEGIFAMVALKFAYGTMALVGSYWLTGLPRLVNPFRRRSLQILAFSSHLLRSRIIGFANANVSLFAIGMFLGPTGAGLFRAGVRFNGAVSEIIAEPVRALVWNILRDSKQGQGGRERPPAGEDEIAGVARVDAANVNVAIYFVAIPCYLGLATLAPNVVELMLGQAWLQAAPVLSALALASLLQIAGLISEPILAVRGHVRLLPRLSLLSAAIVLAALCLLAPFGLVWAVFGQLLTAIVMFPVTVWIQSRYGGIDWRIVVQRTLPIGVAGLVMALTVFCVDRATAPFVPLAMRTALDVAVGVAAYPAMLALLAPSLIENFMLLVRRPSERS